MSKRSPHSPDTAERCGAGLEALLTPGLFRALADGNRLALLMQLTRCDHPCSVSELASCCPVDLSTVSRHLSMLRQAGLLAAEKRGKHVYYRVLTRRLADVLRGIADALEACCGTTCRDGAHDQEKNHGNE
jgi:ArsR family transcriptional regulator